ncbi:MAG: translation initiation factor IF-2, partial [Syntrophobacteraceae bacterium]|nr:translation initiation factor IF-2 [Syntrophobacteraceae bacterium]
MSGMRVHELAKELNMNNKDLIDRILKLGIQAKNHMSVLNEAAVLRIRQQFAEPKTDKLEEKRIGRQVIRRRKRAVEEGLPEAEAYLEEVAEAAASPEETVPLPPETAIPEPVVVSLEAVVSLDIQPEMVSHMPPEPLAEEEAVPEIPEVRLETAVLPELPVEQVEPVPDIAATAAAEPQARPVLDEVPQVPVIEPEIPADVSVEAEQAVEGEEEDEEGKLKQKKTKKRRRKKARKEEPARIIKLPEIIPEEPEEPEPKEVELLQQLAPRLQVKTEEEEPKEVARKKRLKAEELEKEAAERKRKALPPRKEVFEREDLYSKKELAAQADRGRFKDRDRLLFKEALKADQAVPKPGKRKIRIDEAITVANLAKQMGIKAGELLKKLLLLGLPSNINQALDFESAALLASEFEYEVEQVGFEEGEILQVQEDRAEDKLLRPPV